jgi:SET domain-containing protein
LTRLFKVIPKESQGEITFDVPGLEKFFEIHYLPHLTYANWKVEQDIRSLCAQADKKNKVGGLARWLGKLHAREMDEALIPDVTIKWMNEKMGYGVITNRFIRKWAFIGEYTGLVRRRRFIFPNLNDYCFMYPTEWISHKLFTIDSEQQGNYTRFINHSDFPNLESVSVFKDGVFHIVFRAIQDILPGSELSYDYGDVYWRKREKVLEKRMDQVFT